MIPVPLRIRSHRTHKVRTRIVEAVHALRKVEADPQFELEQFELDMAAHLRDHVDCEQLLTLGCEAIVGAGAVLTKDVPDCGRVAGVPAEVIGWKNSLTSLIRRFPPKAISTSGPART